ncbi:BtrH N-terminal domain-containing protein [Brevibacillus laterosporus]|uniref:Butirosin biosynthesis protein H N-terminal domain-containing protein n=1 Tax=Brevibacillus laterosporus TaxID=1465 RepID=A0A0F7C1H8_BRELA|nr:BtrH N-terminal domain-containing protein [Brevibacillus laterosporus]AKF95958.1 hypothetical protein EX87_20495 [Brevibacillus laterosporus]
MEFTLYQSSYHNCKNIVLTAMVKRLGFDIDHLWSQAGLSYQEDEQTFLLTPYYKSILDVLKNLGITVLSRNFSDSESCISALREVLQQGRTIGIHTDLFELPYCMYYQDLHEMHAIEILEVEGDDWTICDHYYRFLGKISSEVLHKAINGTIEHKLAECSIYFLDSELSKDIWGDFTNNVSQIVTENLKVMEGNSLFELSGSETNAIGLEAISLFGNKLDALVLAEDKEQLPLLEECYDQMKEVTNSRYHFHSFLKSVHEEDFAEAVLEASQCWGVATNMVLRVFATESFEGMRERIKKRMNRVMEQEMIVIDKMKVYLKKEAEGSDYVETGR